MGKVGPSRTRQKERRVRPGKDSSWRERVRPYVRVRHRLRSGVLLLRGGWLQILQTAVAACAAWFLSVLLLGVERPTFAPIAAVICLGLAVGERGRRAVELTLGVAFGVAIADFLVFAVGVGALQAGLVVALAVAVFLGREEVGVKEAAISAMIIMIIFHSPDSGLPLERFLEALIGGGTALLINALLPINPERMVEEAAHPLFEESVAVLEEVAGALAGGDAERVQNAYVKAREIDARVAGLKEAVAAGRETARPAQAREPPTPGALRRGAGPDRPDRQRREGDRPRRPQRPAARGAFPRGAPFCRPRPGAGDRGAGHLPSNLRRSGGHAPVRPGGREGGRHASPGPRRPGEKPRRQRARRSDPLLRCGPSREHRSGPGGGARGPGRGRRTCHVITAVSLQLYCWKDEVLADQHS